MAKTVSEQSSTGQVNTFGGGMNKDLHPMQQPSNTYTDMLNGTLITYNDNEQMAQNDMGNYELKHAKLPEGYIPLGIKEYNGILYIISNNPETGKTQIGTYPSPQRLTCADNALEKVISPIELPELANITGDEAKYILENINGKESYTYLTNNHQSVVFTNNFDDDSKLNINDCYELTTDGDSKAKWQELKYKVIGEDKATIDITDKIVESEKKQADAEDITENVGWEQPGWVSARYELDKPESFDQFVSINSINPSTRLINDISALIAVKQSSDYEYYLTLENYNNCTNNYCKLADIIPSNEIWAISPLIESSSIDECKTAAYKLRDYSPHFSEYYSQFGISKFTFLGSIEQGFAASADNETSLQIGKDFITTLLKNYEYVILPQEALQSTIIKEAIADDHKDCIVIYTKLEGDTTEYTNCFDSTSTYYDGGVLVSGIFENESGVLSHQWISHTFLHTSSSAYFVGDHLYNEYIVPNTTVFAIKDSKIINITWSTKLSNGSNPENTVIEKLSKMNGQWSLLNVKEQIQQSTGIIISTWKQWNYSPVLSNQNVTTDIYLKINLSTVGNSEFTKVYTKIDYGNDDTEFLSSKELNVNLSKHAQKTNISKIVITSVPVYMDENNFIIYDNLAKTTSMYLTAGVEEQKKITKFQYSWEDKKVSITLQSNVVIDWDSIINDCQLYCFNGQLLSGYNSKEWSTKQSTSNENTIQFTIADDIEPFYIFQLGDIYSGVVVPGVTKNNEDKYIFNNTIITADDFNLAEDIKITWPSESTSDQFKLKFGDEKVICYIYVPENEGKMEWSNAKISTSPIKPTQEMMVNDACYLGMGILQKMVIDSDVKGSTWTINTDIGTDYIKPLSSTKGLKPGVETEVLVAYNLRKFTPEKDEKNPITSWCDFDYLIKAGYCPVSMMDSDNGDQYNLAPLSYYAGWTDDQYDGGSYINIAKAAGANPEVHVAVSHLLSDGESNLNVSDRGPIYVGDLTGLEDKLPKNQLFYFVQGRVCVNKSGITVPFPMYDKERWYYNGKGHPRHYGPGVASSVLTRESYWVAEKSCLNEYNSRISSGAEITAKQIGAGVAVAIVAGACAAAAGGLIWAAIGASLIAAGGLIGLAIVAVAAVCAALVYGIKWLLGINSKDRYFNAILLRNTDDRDGSISMFTLPVWSSRRNFPAYLMCENSKKGLTGANDIDIAELRMILAMKHIYWISRTGLLEKLQEKYLSGIEVEESSSETRCTKASIKVSCSSGLPQLYQGIAVQEVQNFVENYIGRASMNFQETFSGESNIEFEFDKVDTEGDKFKYYNANSYADWMKAYIDEIISISKTSDNAAAITFHVDYEGISDTTNTYQQNICTALEGFAKQLTCTNDDKGNSIVRLNQSQVSLLKNSNKCFGANSGASWQTIWKECDRRQSHINDYLKIAAGEEPKADYTVIANPVYPSEPGSFLNPHKTDTGSWGNGEDIIQLFDVFGIKDKTELKYIKDIAAITPAKLQIRASLSSYEDKFKN